MKDKRRGFARALRALRAPKAPAGMSARIYDRIGLSAAYVRLPTEIGDVYVAYGRNGVVAVRRARNAERFEAWHQQAFGVRPRREAKPDAALFARLRNQVAGRRTGRLRIDLRGLSAFERAVLEKTREIPRGEVRPYAWVAKEIGKPRAVRAVGSALAKNPVPLLIPCHRVVRSDGSAGSYIFGAAAKRALLTFERAL